MHFGQDEEINRWPLEPFADDGWMDVYFCDGRKTIIIKYIIPPTKLKQITIYVKVRVDDGEDERTHRI